MKKLLAFVVLGLLWCNASLSDEIIRLSRCYYSASNNSNYNLVRSSFDEMKNFFTEYKKEHQIKVWKKNDFIANITEGTGRFENVLIDGNDNTRIAGASGFVMTYYDEDYIKMERIKKVTEGVNTHFLLTIDLKNQSIHYEQKWDNSSEMRNDWYKFICEKKSSETESGIQKASSGSGFFINKNGYFITNHHVIAGCNNKSKIIYQKTEYPAELIASDKKLDLAVLKADIKNKEYLNFSYEPKKMQKIYVAGYPFGKELSDDLKFSDGIVSSLKGFEDNTNQIQISAPINPGNSGGPIVNESGEVVAVAVSGLAKDVTEGINFGIKSSAVETFLKANKVKPSSSFYSRKLNNDKLLKLLEEGTVYTFCN